MTKGGRKMETISFVISGTATILGIWQAYGKKMRSVLIMNLIGNLLVAISYLLVASFSGAAVCLTACVQVVINYIYDMRGKKLPVGLLFCYAAAFCIVNLTVFAGWYDLISLGATMVYVLAMAQSNVRWFRVLYALNSLLWIFYDIITRSYGNLWTHVILLVFTGLSIWLQKRQGGKEDAT